MYSNKLSATKFQWFLLQISGTNCCYFRVPTLSEYISHGHFGLWIFYVRGHKFRYIKWSYKSGVNASFIKFHFFVKNIISSAHYIVITNVKGTGVRIHYVNVGFAKGLQAYFRLAATPVKTTAVHPLVSLGFYYSDFESSFQVQLRKKDRPRSLRRTSTVVPTACRAELQGMGGVVLNSAQPTICRFTSKS